MFITLVATATCPVFLLLDPFTVWKQSETAVERWTRAAVYIMTPHNYVAICLANKHRRFAVVFLVLAFVQVVADFASCGALMDLLRERIVHPDHTTDYQPLVYGYSITAAGFLLFWGPLSISEAFKVATDSGKTGAARGRAGLCGWLLFFGVAFILAYYILLFGQWDGIDILCSGYGPIPAVACGIHGSCKAGQCTCFGNYSIGNATVQCDIDPCARVNTAGLCSELL